jgi:general secretion pathway protein A
LLFIDQECILSSEMYYSHFRLKGPPFQAASPNGAVYFSPTHLAGLATLESGLSQELKGFTLLTGEAGTGKTTLIYSLLQRDYKRVRIAHIDDPKLSFPDIMRVILAQLKLYSTGTTKVDYLEALDRFLSMHDREERIAIIIDEAQVVGDEVLEELRLLSNHVQSHDRCLQLVLVGQPELAERLKKPELRPLNQRIASRGVLKPLSTAQAINYVECKLLAQGAKSSAVFERGALKCLLRRSDGLPRKINTLCHSAMMAAYDASEKKVSFRTAKKIAADYHESVRITNHGFGDRIRQLTPALTVGTALAALLVLSFGFPNGWPNLALGHSVSFGGAKQAARPIAPSKRPTTAKQAVAAGHPESGASPKAAIPEAPRPVEVRASLGPASAAPAAIQSVAARPATVPETLTGPNAPAAAVNAVTPKQIGAPAIAKPRTQISVRYGDTIEKIAIRYLGSKAGINQILDANPQLTNINQLSVGQVINLPPGVSSKSSHNETTTVQPVSNAEDSAER